MTKENRIFSGYSGHPGRRYNQKLDTHHCRKGYAIRGGVKLIEVLLYKAVAFLEVSLTKLLCWVFNMIRESLLQTGLKSAIQ